MQTEKELYDQLLTELSTYIVKEDNLKIIEKAYYYAKKHHEGQYRKSGEDYIIHPLNVAIILTSLQVGPATIAAALMHDIIEDTEVTYEDVENEFSTEIANLVEGVTKIGMIKFSTQSEAMIENHKKLIIGMIKDVRVIIIKLADRLHNMRTLHNLSAEKQRKIANETLEIFAPIGHRLGIYSIKSELEDLSLYYLKPNVYEQIVDLLAATNANRSDALEQIKTNLELVMKNNDIEFKIYGRVKSIYSIYKKMHDKNKTIDEIYDLVALKIVVTNQYACYLTLGLIHEQYRPIPNRFKDYISTPKPNLYQALHTTIIGKDGKLFEIQIKTDKMDAIAEQGIASHWSYKESKPLSQVDEQTQIEDKLAWFRNMISLQGEDYNSEEFIEAVKSDIFSSIVYVFSPKGQTIHLPAKATPIDFAYKIHTEIGHKMVGAKVNGKMVPINYELQTGDVVEILTSKNSFGPSVDWLDIVKTSAASSKIKQFLKVSVRDDAIEIGIEKLRKYFNSKHVSYNDFTKQERLDEFLASYKITTIEELYACVGYGSFKVENILEKYIGFYEEEDKEVKIVLEKNFKTKHGVKVPGVDNLPLEIAKCCRPIPGDEICGFVSKSGVIKVHRIDCPNVSNSEEARQLEVAWDDNAVGYFETYLLISSVDRSTLLPNVLNVFVAANASVSAINSYTSFSMHIINVSILVRDINHLHKVVDNLRKVRGILSVERTVK